MDAAPRPTQTIGRVILGLLLVLGFIGGVEYLLFIAFNWISGSVSGLPKELQAAFLTGFATVTASVVVVTWGRYAEARMKIKEELRARKAPVYEEFFDFSFGWRQFKDLPARPCMKTR